MLSLYLELMWRVWNPVKETVFDESVFGFHSRALQTYLQNLLCAGAD